MFFCLSLFLSQPEVDERLQRLEGDKESLQMQVSILMDQIEAQTEKIADMERSLSERTYQLQRAEEALQKARKIYRSTVAIFSLIYCWIRGK